jgi:hypothetical protein
MSFAWRAATNPFGLSLSKPPLDKPTQAGP